MAMILRIDLLKIKHEQDQGSRHGLVPRFSFFLLPCFCGEILEMREVEIFISQGTHYLQNMYFTEVIENRFSFQD